MLVLLASDSQRQSMYVVLNVLKQCCGSSTPTQVNGSIGSTPSRVDGGGVDSPQLEVRYVDWLSWRVKWRGGRLKCATG